MMIALAAERVVGGELGPQLGIGDLVVQVVAGRVCAASRCSTRPPRPGRGRPRRSGRSTRGSPAAGTGTRRKARRQGVAEGGVRLGDHPVGGALEDVQRARPSRPPGG